MQKFDESSFDKAQIKRRMVERATKIWQTQSSQLDGYDPLVGLLFEACAVELEKVANEIHSTSDRVIDRLSNLMNPDVVDIIQPAHAIIQTRAIDPFTVVMPQEQFFYKAPAGFSAGYNSNKEYFFSPILPFKIFNGEIKFLATQTNIYKLEEGLQKNSIHSTKSSARGKEIVDYQRLWIGIELSEYVETLEGVSIFIDWLNEPQKELYLRKLSQVKWFIDDIELPVKAGIYPEFTEGASLDDEFDALKRIEQQTKLFYNKHFVSFKSDEYDLRRFKTAENKKKKWPVISKVYPEEFEKNFGKEALLHKMRGELVWIEARFPMDFDTSSFQNIYCAINCFPVINRKLNQLTYTLQEHLNIIPLETDEPFLAVKSIIDDENTIYKSSPFTNLENLQFDSYTLRQQGVGRFDSRDAKGLLYYVLELLQDESKAFEALGSEFLNSIIKELNQNIAQLDQQLKLSDDKNQIQTGSIPYVTLRPRKPDNNVSVEFWSCDAEEANDIAAGSPMAAYSDIYIDSDKVTLLTTSTGGRSKLKETEKINALKRNLLTRNRIVTHEDIRTTCIAFLGDTIRDLTIEKNFMNSRNASEGFIRCIQIVLFPSKKSMDEDWSIISQELKIALESCSANNLPYNILYYLE